MNRRDFLQLIASLPFLTLGRAEAFEFAPVVPGRQLVFPGDHGAHPDFRTEWWYVTGWLNLSDSRPLGFQSTFFRVRTGIGEGNESAFAPRQVILAHAAIADPEFKRLRHDERSARAGFGHAGFDTGRADVWIGDWRFEQNDHGYRAIVRGEEFSYALNLAARGAPMLNGQAGFSVKAPDPRHASYYYSQPQLLVDGTVTLAGRESHVTGQAWLDHEWSSELLPESAQGWDWIGINLLDGSALMAFRLRGDGGRALWSAASVRPTGVETRIRSIETATFEPLRHWRSTRTGITYPVEWRVQIDQRVFTLLALMDDQELDSRRSTGAIYWEGAVRLIEDGRVVGRGYLEMTGYGERLRIG